jgi:aspartyl-tRNA(Asn)/glutamyl-tRNA(Gln) amidotransferase subunit A
MCSSRSARIDASDQTVNAFCLLDPDVTLRQARAAEQRVLDGRPAGLLDGVPVAVKDGVPDPRLADAQGFHDRGPVGSLGGRCASSRGPAATRCRTRRQTTTPEIGWKGVTDSPLCGVTRNPWAPDRTAGRSSGGSAAAVALGCAPLALGTDGGGSIRIPCSFCGLVGIKPTYGRVPLWPPSPFGTLAHAGPMTRTVADTALALTVLSEQDPRDPSALPPADDLTAGLDGGIDGMRIAYSPDLGYVDVAPEVRDPRRRRRPRLEHAGAHVEQIDPGFDDPVEIFNTQWYAGAAYALAGVDARTTTRHRPGTGGDR